MKILVCPGNYFYSDKVGSEVLWSIRLLQGYKDFSAVFYESYKTKHMSPEISILNGEATFDGRLLVKKGYKSVYYQLLSFFKNFKHLFDNDLKVIQHMLPYNYQVSFNLLVLFSWNKKVVIGPIQSCRELTFFEKLFYFPARILARLTLLKADLLICSDKLAFEKIRRMFPKKRVVFITPGVDLQEKPSRGNGNTIELLNVGQLIPRKNHIFLVKVLSELFRRNPALKSRVHLTVFGNGPLKNELAAFIRDKHLDGNVTLVTSFVSYAEKAKMFEGKDILVNSSVFESFNSTALDALSFGLPIVSTKVGGYNEVVSHGSNGFLCGNVDAFVDKLALLIKDKNLRNRLSFNNFKTAKAYSWQDISKRYFSEILRLSK